MLTYRAAFLGMIVLGANVGVFAAEQNKRLRPADTSSPRATLRSFLDATNEVYGIINDAKYVGRQDPLFRPAAKRMYDCLDTSQLAEYARSDYADEAAICIKEILDRTDFQLDDLPDAHTIKEEANKGPPKTRYQIPGTRITIALVIQGENEGEYLFTAGSLSRSISDYEDMKEVPYRTMGEPVSEGFHDWYVSAPGHPSLAPLVDSLPDVLHGDLWGLATWKWIGFLIVFLITAALLFGVCLLHGWLVDRLPSRGSIRHWLTLALPVLAALIPLALSHVTQHFLTFRGTPLYVVRFSANIISLLIAIAIITGVFTRIAETIIASPRIQPRGLDAQLIRLLAKLLSITAAVVVFLEGGRYLGVPITTLIASAGVTGLAVALAAQDTLKNLFGSIMIMLDKPFRKGERIIVKGHDGVVEEIGLRSTKLRTHLSDNLVSITNEELARSDIENLGRSSHRFRRFDIHLPLDTPREKILKAVELVRELLDDHEGMDLVRPPRVFLSDLNAKSFQISVMYWHPADENLTFPQFREHINLEILRMFAEHGIQFSPQ